MAMSVTLPYADLPTVTVSTDGDAQVPPDRVPALYPNTALPSRRKVWVEGEWV